MFKLFEWKISKKCSGLILMFHSIKDYGEKGFGTYSTKIKSTDFGEIIEYVSNFYKIISIDELVNCLINNVKTDQFIVITFDDGYLDTYTCVLPIIEKYNVPITIYITTSFIDQSTYPYEFILSRIINRNKYLSYKWKEYIYDYDLNTQISKNDVYQELKQKMRIMSEHERKIFFKTLTPNNLDEYIDEDLFMNWDQVNELKKHSLVTLGSHTVSHPQLDLINIEQACSEIEQSKAFLEDKLGLNINHFAYPYGGYNKEIEGIVKDCNYISAVTTISDFICVEKNDLMELPRVEISSKESIIGSKNINEILIQ